MNNSLDGFRWPTSSFFPLHPATPWNHPYMVTTYSGSSLKLIQISPASLESYVMRG